MNKRNIFYASASILLLFGMLLTPFTSPSIYSPSTTAASPRIIYVNGTYTGSEDGYPQSPFRKIQRGIDNADAGGTVKVAGNCTYPESVTINKPLTLTKWQIDETLDPIIDGSDKTRSYVLYLSASNITVTDFTIKGHPLYYPHCGILCAPEMYGINITNNNIQGAQDSGIYLNPRVQNFTISNNKIENVEYGIRYNDTGTLKGDFRWGSISNNTIDSAPREMPGPAIGILFSGENVSISANDIRDFHEGMRILYSNTTRIASNNCSSCMDGIFMKNLTGNFIEDNFIENCAGRGMVFEYCFNNTVAENVVLSCGMFVDSSHSRGNKIYHNDVFKCISAPPCSEENSVNNYTRNYWGDYNGIDRDGDGFGNIPYLVAHPNTTDNSPRDVPYGLVPFYCKGVRQDCKILGNMVMSNVQFNETFFYIEFNETFPCIEFHVTTSNFTGYCNLTVPTLLLDGKFKIMMEDTPVPCMLTWNKTHTLITFTCSANSTHNVKVIAETVPLLEEKPPPITEWPDLNGDCKIDMKDLFIVIRKFGKSCPPT